MKASSVLEICPVQSAPELLTSFKIKQTNYKHNSSNKQKNKKQAQSHKNLILNNVTHTVSTNSYKYFTQTIVLEKLKNQMFYCSRSVHGV